MSTDEYVPSDEDMAHWFEGEEDPEHGRALWDRWLAAHDARVRREAAREQFENFIANTQTMHDGTHLHAAQMVYAEVIRMAEVYAKAYFPKEESP